VQGEEGVDTDIPTVLEGWLITKTSMSYVDHTVLYVCVCVCVCVCVMYV